MPIHQITKSPSHPFQFGVLGDIHGAFDAARRIVSRHPDLPFWLCVGDLATDDGRYESLGVPLYWIHGNNDNFDAIASGDLPPDLHHIPNAIVVSPKGLTHDEGLTHTAERPESLTRTSHSVGQGFSPDISVGRGFSPDIRIAGLGGTFAPSWYDTPAR